MIQMMICVDNSRGMEDTLVVGQTYLVDVFINGYCDVRNDDFSVKVLDTHRSRFKYLSEILTSAYNKQKWAEKEARRVFAEMLPEGCAVSWKRGRYVQHGIVLSHCKWAEAIRVQNNETGKSYNIAFYDVIEAFGIPHE